MQKPGQNEYTYECLEFVSLLNQVAHYSLFFDYSNALSRYVQEKNKLHDPKQVASDGKTLEECPEPSQEEGENEETKQSIQGSENQIKLLFIQKFPIISAFACFLSLENMVRWAFHPFLVQYTPNWKELPIRFVRANVTRDIYRNLVSGIKIAKIHFSYRVSQDFKNFRHKTSIKIYNNAPIKILCYPNTYIWPMLCRKPAE